MDDESESSGTSDPYVTLWRAVLDTVIRDATRGDGMGWFRPSNADFCMVCDFAGIDPNFLLESLDDILDQRKNGPKRRTIRGWFVTHRKSKKSSRAAAEHAKP